MLRPVSTVFNTNIQYSPYWKFCRDVIAGSDTVKNGGTEYLPKPSGMKQSDYDSYVKRAEFYPATGRTHENLKGFLLMKKIQKICPEEMLDYLNNVDGHGTNLDEFAGKIIDDCLITNWGGILVDAPEGKGESIAQAELEGLFPYLSYYPAEQIINVDYTTKNRNKILSLVVLKETTQKTTKDRFVKEKVTQYRVLEIDEKTGYYKQTLYDDKEKLVSEIVPLKAGKPMTDIPFYFLPNEKPQIPMLKNLADINIAHYRKSADLENGAHWTGVPTPYCLGWQPDTTKIDDDGNEVPADPICLGGSEFIFFPDGRQVSYLEFTGQGCNLLREMMNDDEDRMAKLGARIIATETKGVESVETAKIHRAGENSILSTFANKISDVLTKAVRTYLEWTVAREIPEDLYIRINTDYNVEGIEPAKLTALVSLWQSGGISKRTLFSNLQEGEVIDSDKTFEDEQEEIDEEGVALPVALTPEM